MEGRGTNHRPRRKRNCPWRDPGGAAAIEYALLASLIAVAIVGSLNATGAQLSSSFHKVEEARTLTAGPRT